LVSSVSSITRFIVRLRSREAFAWCSKAAAQRNAEAQYCVGNILLFGRYGIPADQAVKPNIPDGIRWTYMAATNGNTQAYFNMAKVLSEGRGTPTSRRRDAHPMHQRCTSDAHAGTGGASGVHRWCIAGASLVHDPKGRRWEAAGNGPK